MWPSGFILTLEEQLLGVQIFGTVEELRQALLAFKGRATAAGD